jgi:hypothetical protein
MIGRFAEFRATSWNPAALKFATVPVHANAAGIESLYGITG